MLLVPDENRESSDGGHRITQASISVSPQTDACDYLTRRPFAAVGVHVNKARDLKAVGARIREVRRSRGISHKDAARREFLVSRLRLLARSSWP